MARPYADDTTPAAKPEAIRGTFRLRLCVHIYRKIAAALGAGEREAAAEAG